MANKKINQLVAKTTIQSTDLFPLGDATTGQLFKKTIADLQAAIGGAVISVNGLVGTVVLDTDDIQELASPTNRYFTEARARAAISLTTTGSSGASTYSSSTGVLNVPTYTLAGLGGITASFLSGGTGITYNSGTGVISYSGTVYTDASIRALFSAGTGLSYNSSTGAFTNTAPDQTVAIAGGTGISVTGTYPSFTVAYSGNVYTDSSIRGLFSGTAPISFNSSTGAISISQATTSTNGFLSSTDWNTFNGKQSALTIGNLTEATSSVLTITGGTGAVIGSGTSIQVKQASSTVSGFLSSTDWSTFNNKQNTITNPVTGTGTSGYHAKWTSSSAIGNSNLYDSGSNVGLGTTSPAGASGTTLEINGVAGQARLAIKNNATGSTSSDGLQIGVDTGGAAFIENRGANSLQLNTNGSARLFITSAGNVGIGTTYEIGGSYVSLALGGSKPAIMAFRNASSTDMGYVYVNSSTGLFTVEAAGANPLLLSTNGTERMRITSAGNVGIGVTAPTGLLQLNGSIANSADSSTFIIKQSGTSSTNGLYIERNGERNGYFMFIGGGVDSLTFRRNYFGTQSNVMSLTRDGNILLGTDTDNGERLYVGGSIRATGSITANSDVRLKKNIERIENA